MWPWRRCRGCDFNATKKDKEIQLKKRSRGERKGTERYLPYPKKIPKFVLKKLQQNKTKTPFQKIHTHIHTVSVSQNV